MYQCCLPSTIVPRRPATGILLIFNRDEHLRGVSVIKKVGDQEDIEPIRQLQIKTGFACLKFVK